MIFYFYLFFNLEQAKTKKDVQFDLTFTSSYIPKICTFKTIYFLHPFIHHFCNNALNEQN